MFRFCSLFFEKKDQKIKFKIFKQRKGMMKKTKLNVLVERSPPRGGRRREEGTDRPTDAGINGLGERRREGGRRAIWRRGGVGG